MKSSTLLASLFLTLCGSSTAFATGGSFHFDDKYHGTGDSCHCGDCGSDSDCLIVFDFDHSSQADVNSEFIENVSTWENGFVLFGAQRVPGLYTAETSFSFDIAEGYKLDIEEISFTTQSTFIPFLLKTADFTLTLDNANAVSFSESGDGSFYKQSYTFTPNLMGLTGSQAFTFDLESAGLFKWSLDDFEVCGTLSVVPEPSTVASVALFGIGSIYFSRRRKQRGI